MPVLRIQGFSGSVPVTGDRAIGDNFAVESFNTWLYGQELRGVRSPKLQQTILSSTRRVLRIPKRTSGSDPDYPGVPPPSYMAPDDVWKQWDDHDTDVVKGQLIEDKFERYYFCSPSRGPRFNTYDRMLHGLDDYKLGVPGPTEGYDGDGTHPTTPTIDGITPMIKSDDLFEIEFRISVGATGSTAYTNAGGTGNRTASITVTGGTALFDWSGTSTVANASHLIDGDKVATGLKLTDLTALAANNIIHFDFGANRIIDQFKWYQANETEYGDWDIHAATAAAPTTFVKLGTVRLGGSKEQTFTVSNTTAYRNYKMTLIADTATIMTTCSYVYTWVNEFGEESAPSLPVLGAGDANGLWTIGNIQDPPVNPPTVDHPLYTKKRIYRTLSGGSANFYRVSEHVIGAAVPDGGWTTQTTYVDDHHALSDVKLTNNLPLESTYWQPPPDTLQGWIAMPNGFLIAFDKAVDDTHTPPNKVGGNTIYMSEPYHWHAWPPQYKYSTETPIVGLGVIGQSCVVATQGYPTMVTGIKPGSCSFAKVTTGEPCLARGSVVSTPSGVLYASQNGLVMIGPGGVNNVTAGIITRDEWVKDYVPQFLRAVRYQNGYLALRMYPIGSVPLRSGFFLDPTALRVALTEFSDFDNVVNFNTDFWSGEVLMLKPGEVYHWDKPPKPGPYHPTTNPVTFMPTRWKSKEFQFPYEENFGAYAIYWDELRYSDTTWGTSVLPVGKRVQFTVYANRQIKYQQDVPRNGRAIRLPSGFKADIWQFEIRARVPVYSLHVASTVKELKAV